MLTSITVENFRGIERLHVEGLGRVNLIIGRNDSGKTALMEALEMAWLPEGACFVLAARQSGRNAGAVMEDFDDFWLPIFRQMDAKRGFQLKFNAIPAEGIGLSVKRAASPPPTTSMGAGASLDPTGAWALEFEVTRDKKLTSVVRSSAQGVQFPPEPPHFPGTRLWVSPSPGLSANDIRAFSRLKQTGRDSIVTDLLKHISDKISGIELLAPTGERVGVFVRLQHEGLIPLQMMGEGMKRYFEFAVSLAMADDAPLFIDEIENGLHHSVLEPLWDWIASTARERNAQVFATTHSEECVQSATRVFQRQHSDELRVIRLDKQEHETKAVVYDSDLVEAAERMGVEIRG
ncbi:AAA family ATPase [Corallococcus exiguus]|uniref:AAA family ATPase n=1 Tax=Corallococcus exiguus TaxID=83462 RepID=UPI001A8E7530|nr:ATP-binding protein [Corallococcus exiguus]MBN8472866.1 AAA family ATPase [Corallococcus exiguus]